MNALAAHRRRTLATVATLTVGLLLAAWLLRGALPEAKADPSYQRTAIGTCSFQTDIAFWPQWNASAVATIDVESDGSEHIVGVGPFNAWLSDRQSGPQPVPTDGYWIEDVWTSTPEAIGHEIGESGGKSVGWMVGGTLRTWDKAIPVNCSGRFDL
jgi:hypothetical protein